MIISKIVIHPMYYLVALLAIITGFFSDFIIFTTLILIHEIGHLTAGVFYNWNVEKTLILPFGGITIFKEHLNKSMFEEFLILIMGPLFQIAFVIIISFFYATPQIVKYSNFILLFNLLPIFPLDGSKLLNLVLNKIFPFKKSLKLLLSISLICIGVVLFKEKNNLLIVLVLALITYKVIMEFKNISYIFNKFLFERYLYQFNFKKRKIIIGENYNALYREKIHLFLINNKYYTENEMLKKKFYKK